MLIVVLAVAHVGLAAVWLGSMLYSLLVVQPRAARFLAADDDRLEEFFIVLGAGNRRAVLAIIAGLLATGAMLVAAVQPSSTQVVLYAGECVLLLTAATVFVRVSWQLWPRRVFALAAERPAHRASLRRHALAMTALVGAAFAAAVAALATT